LGNQTIRKENRRNTHKGDPKRHLVEPCPITGKNNIKKKERSQQTDEKKSHSPGDNRNTELSCFSTHIEQKRRNYFVSNAILRVTELLQIHNAISPMLNNP
jgi:hypothetical protein